MASVNIVEAEEVSQIIRVYLAASRAWDQETIAQIFAGDAHAIHFGTAADETYIGGASYLQAMKQQHTTTIPDMAFDFLPGSPVVQARDNVAWVVAEARISGTTAKGRYFQFNTRLTFVLEKIDDAWQIVHSHYSIGVPPPA